MRSCGFVLSILAIGLALLLLIGGMKNAGKHVTVFFFVQQKKNVRV